MPTYILTWNPKRWHWPEEDYTKEVTATKKRRLFPTGWTCGNTTRILPGDRIFLLKQVAERGIIQSGYATSEVYEIKHWEKSRRGETALYVEYQSDTLLRAEERLTIERLVKANLGVHWNRILASGVSVPEEDALRLEEIWQQHLVKLGRHGVEPITFPEEQPTGKYVEGATNHVVVNSYERSPKARADCLAYYGVACAVCDFSFAEVYGDIGDGYIHVHHLRDLAKIRRSYHVDPIKDLRPVCPNCHAMLHQTSPAMTVKELRKIVKRRV